MQSVDASAPAQQFKLVMPPVSYKQQSWWGKEFVKAYIILHTSHQIESESMERSLIGIVKRCIEQLSWTCWSRDLQTGMNACCWGITVGGNQGGNQANVGRHLRDVNGVLVGFMLSAYEIRQNACWQLGMKESRAPITSGRCTWT